MPCSNRQEVAFASLLYFSSCASAVQLNRTCPAQNVDAQTGRCRVKIAFVPQDIFAFPVLNGEVTNNGESLEQDQSYFASYQQLYPVAHSFNDEDMSGCKDMAMPCPALGVDMEIMSRIFGDLLDWDFTLVPYYTYPSALYAARVGNVDMTWAALSITATREACSSDCPLAPDPNTASSLYSCCVDFSYQYWEGGLAVVSAKKKASQFHEALFTTRMLNVFAVFAVLLILVGHGMWLIESRTECGRIYFPRPYIKGVFQGIYWACTTATTVGYGDTGPTTGIGKIFTMIWMFVGIVFAGILSGVMASALTVNDLQQVDISSLDQLSGQRVCFVAGYSEEWLNKQGAGVKARKAPSLLDCVQQLEDKSVDAVLFDKPWLDRYHSIGRFGDKLGVSALLSTADYGVAFPEGSILTHRISSGLLSIMSDELFKKTLRVKWLGETEVEETTSSSDEDIGWITLIIASALFVWLVLANLAYCLKPKCASTIQLKKSKSIDMEPWRSPGFNEMEAWLLKTIGEVKSEHAELTRAHQDLVARANDVQNGLQGLQFRYSCFAEV